MKSAPSLLLEIRPSRFEAGLTVAICSLAIIASALSGLPAAMQGVLAAFVVLAAIWRRRLARISISRCALQPDGSWQIESGSASVNARLVDSRDLGILISLQFKCAQARRIDLGLWPDSIPLETRRKLRVWLNGTGATAANRY